MSEQFQEQGGAATMDPSPLLRWLTSTMMTRMSSPQWLAKKRSKFEKQRVKSGQPHVVEYFHQLDDGYSHLVAQVLQAFAARYDVELVCHLVSGPIGKNVAEPEMLLKLARYDAFHVAPHYGLEFPEHNHPLDETLVELAATILAAQDAAGFIEHAAEVGQALWADDEPALKSLAQQYGCVSPEQAQQ